MFDANILMVGIENRGNKKEPDASDSLRPGPKKDFSRHS